MICLDVHSLNFSYVEFVGSFPVGSVVKNPPASAGDTALTPGSERAPGKGDGHLLQCSCLRNPMDRGTRQAIVYGVAKESDMT